jgi:hypothetical protein
MRSLIATSARRGAEVSADASSPDAIGFLPSTQEDKLEALAVRNAGVSALSSAPPEAQGEVKGAWGIFEEDAAPEDDLEFLPSGCEVSVKEGEAFLVKDGNSNWLNCQFLKGGTLVGPLLHKSTRVLTVDELLKRDMPGTSLLRLVGMVLGLFLFVLAIQGLTQAGYFAWADESEPRKIWSFLGFTCLALITILGSAEAFSFAERKLEKMIGLHDRRLVRSVALPDRARHLIAKIPEIPDVVGTGDAEIDGRMQAYRQSLGQLDRLTGANRPTELRMIRHSAEMIERVAAQAQSAGHLGENVGLRDALAELIERADANARSILADQRVREQERLLSDIATLQSQMDLHTSRKDA